MYNNNMKKHLISTNISTLFNGDIETIVSNISIEHNKFLVKIPIHNLYGEQFVFSQSTLIKYELYLKNLVSEARKLRMNNEVDCLSSSYLISEINFSLRLEGMEVTRKKVGEILKQKRYISDVSKIPEKIEKIVLNMDDALHFILNNKISERNLYCLYLTLTKDIDINIIEDEFWYRQEAIIMDDHQFEKPKKIKKRILELLKFINNDNFSINTRAIISHYIFEEIHPYYAFNRQMSRMLHLWILLQAPSHNEFWNNVLLSENLFAFKDRYFELLKGIGNKHFEINLTNFMSQIMKMFIKYTTSFLKMKTLTNKSLVPINKHTRWFIMDILCEQDFSKDKWYTMELFKEKYKHYSKTISDRILKQIKESKMFEIKNTKPIEFRIKQLGGSNEI